MGSGGGRRRARRLVRVHGFAFAALALFAGTAAGGAGAAGAVPGVIEPAPLPLPPVLRGGAETTPPVTGTEATPPPTTPPTVDVPPAGTSTEPPAEASRVVASEPGGHRPSAPSRTPAKPSAAPAQAPAAPPVVPAVAVDDKPAVARLREATVPAARQFRFPLGLAALVLGFLAVQSRLDRRDPKLAMAPVSVDDDLLHFT